MTGGAKPPALSSPSAHVGVPTPTQAGIRGPWGRMGDSAGARSELGVVGAPQGEVPAPPRMRTSGDPSHSWGRGPRGAAPRLSRCLSPPFLLPGPLVLRPRSPALCRPAGHVAARGPVALLSRLRIRLEASTFIPGHLSPVCVSCVAGSPCLPKRAGHTRPPLEGRREGREGGRDF